MCLLYEKTNLSRNHDQLDLQVGAFRHGRAEIILLDPEWTERLHLPGLQYVTNIPDVHKTYW